MYRIYKKGNYVFIENTTTNIRMEGLAKDVRVRTLKTDSDVFFFDNINSSSEISKGLNISQIIDESDQPYTIQSFSDFYTTQTGGSIQISLIDGNA